MRSAIVAFAAAAVVMLSGSGSSSAAKCIAPSRFSHAHHLASGVATSVRVGALIEVRIDRTRAAHGVPDGLPLGHAAVTTNAHVLVAVFLSNTSHNFYARTTVPRRRWMVSITLFRAVHAGRATVSARVAPAWLVVQALAATILRASHRRAPLKSQAPVVARRAVVGGSTPRTRGPSAALGQRLPVGGGTTS